MAFVKLFYGYYHIFAALLLVYLPNVYKPRNAADRFVYIYEYVG